MNSNILKNIVIDKPEHVELLASPVRNQIHLAMEMLGECSVPELAKYIGRSTHSLYFHINQLVDAGIVHQIGERSGTTKPEAVYSLLGKRIIIDPKNKSPHFLKAFAKGIRTLLRFAERLQVRSLENPQTRKTGVSRNFRIQQMGVRLTGKSLKEFNRRLEALQDFVSDEDDPKNGTHYIITYVMSLAEEKSK